MDSLFKDFANAYAECNGYSVAQTLSPVAPPTSSRSLKQVWQSTNHGGAKGDIKHHLRTNLKRQGVQNDEIEGWTEVFTAYWKATGEITAGESGKVCLKGMIMMDKS